MVSVMPRFAALLACLAMASPAWSQHGDDRGQWQILSARYGTAQRNVDVTQTLKNLARQDTRFEVNNRTMGSDPAPGRPEILWVTYYAGGRGQQQVKVYEKQQLTLP